MARRKGFTIGKFRSTLYLMARLLGDVQAVRQGRVGRRIAARTLGKASGRAQGGILDYLFRRK